MDLHRLAAPDDFHVHLRQDDALADYARQTASQFRRALVMPNTLPPISSVAGLTAYREWILRAAPSFEPLMSFKVTEELTEQGVQELAGAGAVAGKLYPRGVTTHAEDGVRDVQALYPALATMEREGLVLCIHGEEPGTFILDRERAFLPRLVELAERFPTLRIVFEHASTKEAVACVAELPPTVAATITVHHLLLTLDDLLGTGIVPHHFCKPVVQTPADRAALRHAAFSGSAKFFFGSDSAPHPRKNKECAHGAAGVYSAPVALPALCELFVAEADLATLEAFTSRHGADFYGLPHNEGTVALAEDPWQVPSEVDGAVPLLAGRTLRYRMRHIVE
jgi:dihydroorotase